ncbi:hypothetical protein ACE6H2_018904 [Prunus campanulata]
MRYITTTTKLELKFPNFYLSSSTPMPISARSPKLKSTIQLSECNPFLQSTNIY